MGSIKCFLVANTHLSLQAESIFYNGQALLEHSLHLFLSLRPFFTSASISIGKEKKGHFLLPFHLCAFEESIKANGFAFG